MLLLAASIFFFQFLGMFQRDNLGLVTQGVVFILFVGPLLASGLALLAAGPGEGDEDDEQQTLPAAQGY